MAIDIGWDDETKTILRWTMQGTWTWDDFWAAIAETDTYGASVQVERVDLLVDFSHSGPIPAGALSVFRRANRGDNENQGLIVICGTDRLATTLLDTFRRIYRASTWRSAPNVEAGRAVIHANRAQTHEAV